MTRVLLGRWLPALLTCLLLAGLLISGVARSVALALCIGVLAVAIVTVAWGAELLSAEYDRRLPGLTAELGVGSLTWTWQYFRLAAAGLDARVRSDAALRGHAVNYAADIVLSIVALAGLLFVWTR